MSATTPTDRPSPQKLYTAFASCALIWGSTFLVISIGNDAVPPLWGAAIRLALAAMILTAITWMRGEHLPRGAARTAAFYYGVFNLGINFALLYWGEKYVASGLSAVFYATIPLTSTFMASRFGLERVTPMKVLAAAIAFIGVTVISWDQIRSSHVSPVPVIGLFLAATIAGFGALLLKRGPRQSAIAANAFGSMFGCGVCLAGSFLIGEPHALPRSFAEVFPIVYLTLTGSVGAFVLFAWLVNHWEVSRVSFVSVIVPVVAMIMGAAFRNEHLSLASLLGSALVISGVLVRIQYDRTAARRA